MLKENERKINAQNKLLTSYSSIAISSTDYASYLHALLRSGTLKSCKSWYQLNVNEIKRVADTVKFPKSMMKSHSQVHTCTPLPISCKQQ